MVEQSEYYIDKDGDKFWYLPSKSKDYYHRLDGPAIEYANGTKLWWVNDKRHRIDGPAIERADGSKEWWVNGKRYRIDGPAVEWANGTKEWWLYDKHLPTAEVESWIKENNIDLKTIEGQMAFKLRWV